MPEETKKADPKTLPKSYFSDAPEFCFRVAARKEGCKKGEPGDGCLHFNNEKATVVKDAAQIAMCDGYVRRKFLIDASKPPKEKKPE